MNHLAQQRRNREHFQTVTESGRAFRRNGDGIGGDELFDGQGRQALDGMQGLIIAMVSAYGVFMKYAKLWEQELLHGRPPTEKKATDGT